jgi:hypothetical protein
VGVCPEVVRSVGACSPRDSGLVGVLGVGAPPGVLVEYEFICPNAAVHRSIIDAIIITFHFIYGTPLQIIDVINVNR